METLAQYVDASSFEVHFYGVVSKFLKVLKLNVLATEVVPDNEIHFSMLTVNSTVKARE